MKALLRIPRTLAFLLGLAIFILLYWAVFISLVALAVIGIITLLNTLY